MTYGTSAQTPQLSKTQLLAFFAMIIGMFMAILDIQIVASSLSVIAAGLSASSDELSWIQTAYLIAEVIIIPASGFISRVLSTRISFFIAALGFTVMSILCSTAWNIESMIVFRSLQGFFGGALIPSVFSAIFIIFPPKQRPTVTIIVGLVVTMAPTVGPTIGGYITELLSWHFMFLLNVIPGIFVCTTVFLYADFDEPDYSLLENFDYVGVLLMTVTLASLQYILEEGNKKDWLDDSLILLLSVVSISGFILLIIREITFVNPILDLSAFKDRNFTMGCIYSSVLGIGLYGVIYVLPLFLFSVAGYSTLQIGATMMVTGIFQFLSAPIAGKAVSTIDSRIVLGIGLTLFGTGCYANSFLTADSKYWEFFIPQMIRGASLMFCFIPANNIVFGTMPKNKIKGASGLYNLMRNLGGAIGLAVISNILTSRTTIYSQYLGENVTATSPYVIQTLEKFKLLLNGKVFNTEEAAFLTISNILHRDAFIMAANHVFVLIGMIFFACLILLPFTANIVITDEQAEAH